MSKKQKAAKKIRAAVETKAVAEVFPCAKCGKDAGRGGHCYGCLQNVCEACCTNFDAFGKHSVEAHWASS